MLRERDTGSAIDPSKTTLGQYLDHWLADIQVEPKTRERYAGLIAAPDQAVPWARSSFRSLSHQAVKTWHTTLRTKGARQGQEQGWPLTDRSVLHAHRVLATALGEAQRCKLIGSNPAADIEQPKVRPTKTMQILRMASRARCWRRSPATTSTPSCIWRWRPACAGASCWPWPGRRRPRTGRPCGWSARLEQTKAGLRFKEPKTEAGTRTITIPASTVQVLREHKVRQLELRMKLGLGKEPADALVFPELDGSPMDPDKLSKAWKRACKALDLPLIDFHGLRHTHASALIAAKEDIVKISRRLGHAQPGRHAGGVRAPVRARRHVSGGSNCGGFGVVG